jgi:hypothetical protein
MVVITAFDRPAEAAPPRQALQRIIAKPRRVGCADQRS